ncbi:unnamed protein product [Camellia sinensis]
MKLLYKIAPLLSNSSNDNITRLVMSFSGELQLFNWDNNGQWHLIWSELRDKCSVYNAWGDFGSCNSENSGLKYCKCLPGFEPNSPDEWNSGEFSSRCTRKTTTCLTDKKKYTFLKFMMKVEDPDSPFEAKSEQDCESECVASARRILISYHLLLRKESLVQTHLGAEFGPRISEIFTRIRKACIVGLSNRALMILTNGPVSWESTSRDCEPCGANILPYPLCPGQNCGDPMYNNIRCNKSTGQVEFQEPRGIYRVTSINPDNLTFIIQLTDTVENANICRANNFRVSPSLPYKVIGSSCNAGLAVEISWDLAPQPTCTLLEDCKDWPNSSCNTTEDGKRSVLGNDNSTRKKKKSFSFVIHFMVAMILVVLICISGYIWYKRRKLKQRQDANKLGQWGFGPVYKGYCIKGDEKILLYEYMPNKSLDSFIFDRTLCMSLDWDKRFDIILGIARGLLYLHQDSRLRIIHRDLETSNILLDGEMNPKISDFGLARIVGGKETKANIARVVGTYGYMSPEYALDGLLSIKFDVFSFGVIVLEIVSGKRNTGFYKSQQAFNLFGSSWRFWREEKALGLIDQTLIESCNRGEVMRCITVGLLCVQEEPSDRPSMPNVVFMLGSESATLPNPKPPAFLAKNWLSNAPSSSSSSSSKPETFSDSALTVSVEEGR